MEIGLGTRYICLVWGLEEAPGPTFLLYIYSTPSFIIFIHYLPRICDIDFIIWQTARRDTALNRMGKPLNPVQWSCFSIYEDQLPQRSPPYCICFQIHDLQLDAQILQLVPPGGNPKGFQDRYHFALGAKDCDGC